MIFDKDIFIVYVLCLLILFNGPLLCFRHVWRLLTLQQLQYHRTVSKQRRMFGEPWPLI